MNDLERAKVALRTGHADEATALALIVIAEYLTAPPIRFVLNNYHEEPIG